MKIDRTLQLEMLEKLAEASPYDYDFNKDYQSGSDEYKHALANLNYLQMHKMVENAVLFSKSLGVARSAVFGCATITEKGLDFLEQDGGISAILSTITIKLHNEQLQQILANYVNQSDLNSAHKQLLTDELLKLPAESTKHLVNLLLTDVYQNPQAIVGTIQKFLGLLF